MNNATAPWRPVWERARAGRHTLVSGVRQRPPVPTDLYLLAVNCATPQSTVGPLEEALRQVRRLLGAGPVARPPTGGARYAAPEERLPVSVTGELVAAGNRLADWGQGRVVLCFGAVEAADPTTLEALTAVVRRAGWLRLPLLLLQETDTEQTAALARALRENDGDAALVTIADGSDQASAPAAAVPSSADPTSASASASPSTPSSVSSSGSSSTSPAGPERLSPAVLQVLRAGAVGGAEFDAAVVARLLERPPGAVLAALQTAYDQGVPLTDRGDARFGLPESWRQTLCDGLLPSLREHWHRRFGELLSAPSGGGVSAAETDPAGGPVTVAAPAVAAGAGERGREPEAGPGGAGAGLAGRDTPGDVPGAVPGAVPGNISGAPEAWPGAGGAPAADGESDSDPLRAADHLRAAGRVDAALAQTLNAVDRLVAAGDAPRALQVVQQGLEQLARLPVSALRGELRARLLLAQGRLQWQGDGSGEPFTLPQALASLRAADQVMPAEAPLELRGRVAAALAGVCYDLGDLPALREALATLHAAASQLTADGGVLAAAQLLNGEASLYLHLGETPSAVHLLEQARRLLEARLQRAENNARAPLLAELGQTHHLYAKLPLHRRADGDEAAATPAVAAALEHAEVAERLFRTLNALHDLGRVWETGARLELLRERRDPARQRLEAALTLQQRLGDGAGLARSSAALGELYAMLGQWPQALALLSDSISLNAEKGSPLGLAFNRRALQAMETTLERQRRAGRAPSDDALAAQLARLEQQLAGAETVVGRYDLRRLGPAP